MEELPRTTIDLFFISLLIFLSANTTNILHQCNSTWSEETRIELGKIVEDFAIYKK